MNKQKWELIWELAKTDFKIRYNGSVLGYLWALLKPLLIFLILNFIFSHVFGANIKNYSINLLTGLMIWMYFSEATMTGMQSLVGKSNLILKVKISKSAIIFASTLHNTMTFLINLIILTAFLFFYHITPSLAGIALTIVFLFLTYVLILGFNFLTAPLYTKYRDLNQIWEVLLNLGFYASPIIYPLSIIPGPYQKFLWINPVAYLIHYSKLALIDNQFISVDRLIITVGVVGFILVAGVMTFLKMKPKIAENL